MMKHIKISKQALVILLLIVLITATVAVPTIAKYVADTYSDHSWNPEAKFYFESDLLSLDGKTHTVKGNTIAFELYNYADETRISERNIAYTIEVKQGETVIGSATTGTLAKSTKSSYKFSHTGLADGTYTVTATSTDPFVKTLTATFVINNQTIEKNVEKSNNVVKLTVRTNDYTGALTVTWSDTNLVPDNTNPAVASATISAAGGSLTSTTLAKNAEYTFVFFKKNPNTDSGEQFTVTTP